MHRPDGRAISTHSGSRLPPARRLPDGDLSLPRILASGDVPIAHRSATRSNAQQGFEGDMAIEAAIVTKHEFIEIAVHVLATQAMIRAKAPSLHERKDPMNPRQRHMARHLADDTRVMAVAP